MVLGCVTANKQALVANECISFTGHFDGHADALEQWQCAWQHLMQNDKCYTGSLWIYAIRRPLAPYCPGSRQDNNLQNDNEQVHTRFAGHFDGHCHCGAAVQYQVHRLMEDKVHGFLLEATSHHHWASIHSNNKNRTFWDHFFVFFSILISLKKGCEVKGCPPTNNMSMKYQTDEKLFSKPILDT